MWEARLFVDLETGDSCRRLHDQPSTKAEVPPRLNPLKLGSDGIAISADGKTLYYCPLMSRRLSSVAIDALADRSLAPAAVAALRRGCHRFHAGTLRPPSPEGDRRTTIGSRWLLLLAGDVARMVRSWR
jgi:sugar lactone lactonase YvrE